MTKEEAARWLLDRAGHTQHYAPGTRVVVTFMGESVTITI